MKDNSRSLYVCPGGAAVYLYLTHDLVNNHPLKDWSCPNFLKCEGCKHAHIPSDKRRKKTCDFNYAFNEVWIMDQWMSADELLSILDGCSIEAQRIITRPLHQFTLNPFYSEWLKENKAEILKKWRPQNDTA